MNLSYILVVGYHVGVFEENNRVGLMAFNALGTKGVATFVTSKYNFMGTMSLHFAKRLHLFCVVKQLLFSGILDAVSQIF